MFVEENLKDSEPLLQKEDPVIQSPPPSEIPTNTVIVNMNKNFDLSNYPNIVIRLGYEELQHKKPTRDINDSDEEDEYGMYSDFKTDDEKVVYEEIDVDWNLTLFTFTNWGHLLGEMNTTNITEDCGIQFLETLSKKTDQISTPIKLENLLIKTKSLLNAKISFVLFKIQFPNVDQQLQPVMSKKKQGGYSRKVVIKKTPRTNRFVTRCIDSSTNEEFCRFITLVDPIHNKDAVLVGMVYHDSEADCWKFRATNTFQPFPPKSLIITQLKCKNISTGDGNNEIGCNLIFGKQKAKSKPKKSSEWNEQFEL